MIPKMNGADFESRVLGSNRPVLVQFSTPWWPYCRVQRQELDALAGEYEGRIQVVEIDVEEEPGLGERYDVTAVPTTVLIRGGHVIRTWVGSRPSVALREALDSAIAEGVRAGGE